MRPRNQRFVSIMSLVVLAGCYTPIGGVKPPPSSEPAPPPPPPTEAAATTPEPPPPEQPAEFVAIADLRGVASDLVSQDDLRRMSETLMREVGPKGRPLDVDPGASCVDELCQLRAAGAQSATGVLHTRLIQYGPTCMLTGVLYSVQTQRSEWGFLRQLSCDPGALQPAMLDLATDFVGRGPASAGSAYAVIPIQHRVRDLDWAAESFSEYMTGLLTEAGLPAVPASVAAQPLAGRADPHTACGRKCPLDVGASADVERVLAASITKRRQKCTVTVELWNVLSRARLGRQKASGGCGSMDVIASMQTAIERFQLRPDAAPAAPAAPADEAPAAEPADDMSGAPADSGNDRLRD